MADGYIHCRELWPVSLENVSILEWGIKKIFFIFLQRNIEIYSFVNSIQNFVVFIHIFPNIWHNFRQFANVCSIVAEVIIGFFSW